MPVLTLRPKIQAETYNLILILQLNNDGRVHALALKKGTKFGLFQIQFLIKLNKINLIINN